MRTAAHIIGRFTKLALATIVRAYRIDTPVTYIPLTPGITLRPSAPLPLRLTARAQP